MIIYKTYDSWKKVEGDKKNKALLLTSNYIMVLIKAFRTKVRLAIAVLAISWNLFARLRGPDSFVPPPLVATFAVLPYFMTIALLSTKHVVGQRRFTAFVTIVPTRANAVSCNKTCIKILQAFSAIKLLAFY